ncbi:hypothetical protein [Micromonospora sp. NPDC006431]
MTPSELVATRSRCVGVPLAAAVERVTGRPPRTVRPWALAHGV